MPSKIVVGTPFFVVFEGKRMNKAGEFLGKNLVYGCIKLLEQWKFAISGICTKISIVIVDLHSALSDPANWWKV